MIHEPKMDVHNLTVQFSASPHAPIISTDAGVDRKVRARIPGTNIHIQLMCNRSGRQALLPPMCSILQLVPTP